MKDRFLIINKGKEKSLDAYLSQDVKSEKLEVLIRREALKEKVQRGYEGEKRKPEYISIANKLGFSWEQNSVIGFANYNHSAWLMMELVMKYSEQLVRDLDFPIYKMRGSNGFNESHEVVQAYADLFGDRLLKIEQSSKRLVMGYDASYPQFNLACSANLSHSKLPFAHYSVSDCYRNEQSGECMLLFRQRRFFMPDLHPYFKDIDDAFKAIPLMHHQLFKAGADNGISYQIHIEVNGEENWVKYKDQIIEAMSLAGVDYLVQIINDDKPRYWIVNIDYKYIDSLGQAREIGCIQIDVGNASRLDINYIDQGNDLKHPVIIHSAIPGGIERYLYAIIDSYVQHQSFPLWLQPIQCRLIPVSDKHNQRCLELAQQYKNILRIDVDDRSEVVGKKVKKAKDQLVQNIIVFGEDEDKKNGNWELFVELLKESEISQADFPFIPLNIPCAVSRQI